MQDIFTYHIQVQGNLDKSDLSTAGPLPMTVVRADSAATLFTIHADQSGLIGLLRYLHQQGYVLLSVSRK